jgi:hypothetical protein
MRINRLVLMALITLVLMWLAHEVESGAQNDRQWGDCLSSSHSTTRSGNSADDSFFLPRSKRTEEAFVQLGPCKPLRHPRSLCTICL